MNDRLIKLNEKAKTLPKAPGVYLMKNAKGVVIYIGKSASLRDRVSSYFQPSTRLEFKKRDMVDEIVDFDVMQTETEVEALLAENRLIKDTQPKYNARLLDDKTFPYLQVTMRDDYPGVYVTRKPDAKAEIYGPFTSVAALKDAVTHLQKAFKYRTCHLEILEEDPKKRFFRPCLLYNIGQCTAPCADKISRAEYGEDIKKLLRFLDGNRTQLLNEMHKEMVQASKDMNFEAAAKIRDQIKALQALDKRAGEGEEQYWQPEAFVHNPQEAVGALQEAIGMAEVPRVVEGIDIAHLMGGEMVGSLVCFIDGVPFKNGYRRFKIKHGQGNNDYLSIQEVVTRRYREPGQGHELFPDVILIDGGLGQLHAAMDAFKLMDVRPPMVISLAKKEELIYTQAKSEPIRLPRNHLGLKMLQYLRDEAHRFAQHYHHILRRKAQLEEDVKAGRRPPALRRKRIARLPEQKPAGDVAPLPSTIPNLLPTKPAVAEPQIEGDDVETTLDDVDVPPESRFAGDNE